MSSPTPYRIPFFRPCLTGREETYMKESLSSLPWSGDGKFSQLCCDLLKLMTGRRTFLTPSATHGLELAFMSLGLQPGDEVILPSYTFVSTANALVVNGLTPVFIDIRPDTLNLDERLLEQAITPRTRAVLPVHYAGIACDMEAIGSIAKRYGLAVVEDAAHGVNAFYKGRALGALGDLGVYSFHDTKNITCGQGGALVVGNEKYLEAVEIHRQKGTDRSRFLLGQVDKYSWVDRGSNYMLSDILAAFLLAQLEAAREVTARRKVLFERYLKELSSLTQDRCRMPAVPEGCSSNYHLFHLLTDTEETRKKLMSFLREHGIEASTHFVPLHNSAGGRKFGLARGPMEVTERIGRTLLRIPLYTDMSEEDQEYVIKHLKSFFG